VGRIYDWHKKASGEEFLAERDPGVRFVREIYDYYKATGVETIVMGASFRNIGQIEALAGCDRFTIAPSLLDALAADDGEPTRALSPAPAALPPGHLAKNAISRWFVSEDAVDIKDLDSVDPMDEAKFRWIMNEDPMATEKPAEGIRVFARDL
jgi:transaldolase